MLQDLGWLARGDRWPIYHHDIPLLHTKRLSVASFLVISGVSISNSPPQGSTRTVTIAASRAQ